MRFLFPCFSLLAFSISGNSQIILDSNHVYNAKVKQLPVMLKGKIGFPNDSIGVNLEQETYGLIENLLLELRKDSLSYITENDSSKMFWNVVGHQTGRTQNHVAFVLTITDHLADDFYDHCLGGISIWRTAHPTPKKWMANGLRFYFVMNRKTNTIIYYYNPMCEVVVDNTY